MNVDGKRRLTNVLSLPLGLIIAHSFCRVGERDAFVAVVCRGLYTTSGWYYVPF